MTRADLIYFNRELLERMKNVGIRMEDYRYCDLYRDYVDMSRTERSRKVVILTLAERYGISDRQVYNIVGHMACSIEAS